MAIDPNIKQKADDIRTKVYGSEVRESLASGLEAMSSDVVETVGRQGNVESQFQDVIENTTDKDVISAPEIIAARNGEANLKARLDKNHNEVTAQLAQKATKEQVEKVEDAVSYKINRGEVQKADIDFSKDENLLDINEFNERSRLILQNMEEGQVNAVLGARNVKRENVAKNAISPTETNFIKGGGGRNLFEGTFIKARFSISGSTYTFMESEESVSAIIPVVGGRPYTTYKQGETSHFAFGFFDEYPTVGSVAVFGFNSSQPNISTYTAPTNAEFMMVHLSNTNQIPTEFQIEQSDRFTRYVSPEEELVINLADESKSGIKPQMTTFAKEGGLNLFEGEFSDITLSVQSGIVASGGKSVIQEVDAWTRYTVTKSGDTDTLRVGFFNQYPQVGQTASKFYPSTGNDFMTVASDASHRYMVVAVSSTSENKIPEKIQIEKGNLPHKYQPKFMLDEDVLSIKDRLYQSSFTHLIMSNQYYSNGAEVFPLSDIIDDVQLLYDKYDALMQEYPDYITRVLLATEYTGLPIYLYRFTPPLQMGYTVNLDVQPPKILYVGAIHGHEQHATVAGYLFFEDLVKNWKDNDILSILRWNTEFLVVPALNPWGYNNGGRKNSRGIDLARNFTLGHSVHSDPNSAYYGGTSPLSEIESQAINNLMKDNPDIAFAIDHHNFNYYTPGDNKFLTWYDSVDERVEKFLVGSAKKLNAKVKRDHPVVDQENGNLVSIEKQALAGMLSQQFAYHGIPGTIVEYVKGLTSTEDELHRLGAEVIGNLIWDAVENLEYLQHSELSFGY